MSRFCAVVGFIFFFHWPFFQSAAQEPILLDSVNGSLINPYIQVYHTPEKLTGKQALWKIENGELQEADFKLNAGMKFPNDSYWITFRLLSSKDTWTNAYLVLDYPQLDYLDLYEVKDLKMNMLFRTGDQLKFHKRPILAPNFVLPLVLRSQDTTRYLLHLQKYKSTMRFPMYLYDEEGYQNYFFSSNLKYSIYFGFILLVSIVAMVLGFIVKNHTFKIYALYVLSFGLWLFTRLGYSYQFLFSDFPEFNRHLLAAVGQLAIMMLIFYVRSFFKTKENLPRFHKIMDVVLIIFLVGAVAWILFPDWYVAFAPKLFIFRYTLFGTTVVFAFVAAVNHHSIDRFRSRMFLLAYSLFLLAILGKILMDYGLFNEVDLLFDPIQLGFLIEVTVLSIAMGVLLKRTLVRKQNLEHEHQLLKEKVQNQKEVTRSGYLKLNSKAIIPISKISYIKADDHYLEFYLSDGQKEIERNTLSHIAGYLPANFIQTHRSYIINLDKARALYSDRILMKNGDEVKLSRTFGQRFKNQLNKE
jgi:hypothetical protein